MTTRINCPICGRSYWLSTILVLDPDCSKWEREGCESRGVGHLEPENRQFGIHGKGERWRNWQAEGQPEHLDS